MIFYLGALLLPVVAIHGVSVVEDACRVAHGARDAGDAGVGSAGRLVLAHTARFRLVLLVELLDGIEFVFVVQFAQVRLALLVAVCGFRAVLARRVDVVCLRVFVNVRARVVDGEQHRLAVVLLLLLLRFLRLALLSLLLALRSRLRLSSLVGVTETHHDVRYKHGRVCTTGILQSLTWPCILSGIEHTAVL